jgi:hypothetical protein
MFDLIDCLEAIRIKNVFHFHYCDCGGVILALDPQYYDIKIHSGVCGSCGQLFSYQEWQEQPKGYPYQGIIEYYKETIWKEDYIDHCESNCPSFNPENGDCKEVRLPCSRPELNKNWKPKEG